MSSKYTVKEASTQLGIAEKILYEDIEEGLIEYEQTPDGILLPQETVDMIRKQQDDWIGIREFLECYAPSTFSTRTIFDIQKYADFLNSNRYWGMEVLWPEQAVFNRDRRNILFLKRCDIPKWLALSEQFMRHYGKSARQCLDEYLTDERYDPELQGFLSRYFLDCTGTVTNTHVEAVAELLTYGTPLAECSDEDVQKMLCALSGKGSQRLLKDIVHAFKSSHDTEYRYIWKQETALTVSRAHPAYTMDTVKQLSGCILCVNNPDRLRQLTEMALEDTFMAEQWLYVVLTMHLMWRPGDIIRCWRYLDLQSSPLLFPEIDRTRIREQVLNDEIPDALYSRMCIYAVTQIQLNAEQPSKTSAHGPRSLQISLGYYDTQVIIGRLLLICEYHHIKDGTGRMRKCRTCDYAKQRRLRAFFGNEIRSILDNQNLIPTALTKVQGQAIEQICRMRGHSPVMAYHLPALARSHKSLSSTSHYMADGAFRGYTPESVINEMFKRGVFSCINMMCLQAALPNEFAALPDKTKTEILEKFPLTPYELEMTVPFLKAACKLTSDMKEGDKESILRLLTMLGEIMEGFHAGKDIGCGCLAIAMGYGCQKPACDCIKDACEFCVATKMALPALYQSLKEISEEYKNATTPWVKAKLQAVLTKKLIPTFSVLMNELFPNTSEEEKLLLIKEECS